MMRPCSFVRALGFLALLGGLAHAQVGVSSSQKVSALAGGFPTGELEAGDMLGTSLAQIGDVDGDGVVDLALGAIGDDDGGASSFLFGYGAVWIVFQNTDGTVKSTQKISATAGGFTGTIAMQDFFGSAVAGLGDLDGDGVPDVAVGVSGADASPSADVGAVQVLFLNSDGTVKASQAIGQGMGGFTGTLDAGDAFGSSLASLGDLDGDGNADLAVGAIGDDDGAADAGAVWILFLNANGTVHVQQKISASSGGLTATLASGDRFGKGLASPGDFDGDGNPDLAVGADRAGGTGAEFLLFLAAAGTVKSEQSIGSAEISGLDSGDAFGSALAFADVNRDGREDLLAGAPRDDDGGTDRGAVWMVFLNADGSYAAATKISSTSGGFAGPLHDGDLFGGSLATQGRLNGDSLEDLAVGAPLDDDGSSAAGSSWTLFLGLKASSVVRNGLGVNPLGFTETQAAVIGGTWNTMVDIASVGAPASLVVVTLGGPTGGVVLSGRVNGEVLALGPTVEIDVQVKAAHSLLIPNDPGLVGVTLATQAATVAPNDIRLQNALDVTFGTF